jgi:hypothetical protein
VVINRPSNFIYLGMIRLMLPHAKVIHCRRDPVDTCLSCFRQFFTGWVPFAWDLAELGQYYCHYLELMRHWRALMPGFVLDVRYEDLVAGQEAQTRRLTEFAGLPWDDKCLNFQHTERAVGTASATQVRQPLYRSAVGASHRYGGHLAPLLAELARCPGSD